MASILIIEDDPILRTAVSEIFTQAGHEVTEVSNVADGLDRMRTKRADLIMTDLMEPNRREAVSISALRREFPAVEIIAISGGSPAAGYLHLAAALDRRRTPAKPFMCRGNMALLNEVFAYAGAYRAHAHWRSGRNAAVVAA